MANQSSSSSIQASITSLEAGLERLNSRFLTVLLDNAVLDGRITPADRGRWREDLERDFENKNFELANTARSIKTERRLENFAIRNLDLNDDGARTKAIQEIVHMKMQRGRSYDQAWFETKQEYPEIFAAMPKPLNIYEKLKGL